MLIGINADNGLSSFIEIDELPLRFAVNPLEAVVVQLIPHLNEIIQRLDETPPGAQ